MERYGAITDVTRDAAALAKSWKELFRCKTVSDKKVEPRCGSRATLLLPTSFGSVFLYTGRVPSARLIRTDQAVSACRLSPCSYELTAVLQRIAHEQAAATQAGGVMFLLDGSGSVSTGE